MTAQISPIPALAAPEHFEVASNSAPSPRASENLVRLSISSADVPAFDNDKKGRKGLKARMGLENVGRRALGIFLLLVTVFLWTASNFLASYIFADNSYSKPYFVTYINTSFFAVSLLPIFIRVAYQNGGRNVRESLMDYWRSSPTGYQAVGLKGDDEESEPLAQSQTRLLQGGPAVGIAGQGDQPEEMLSVQETAKLSLEFSIIWFLANYLVAACLEYTSVASSTILTSTSSIWTLILGALFRVEIFSYKKLIGVVASLMGIILISTVDLSGTDNDDNRGNFPHKSQAEIAIGDAMAFGSAIMYGIYAVVMKKRIGNEDRVNMPLFFGLVGLINVVFLWPGLIVLHFTGVEEFSLPPTQKIWIIVLANSASSFISDYCWAYAMLLTTPLVVTVGLSMTIPLSLVGQMIISEQYSSALYWVGACIVLLSFLFINHESKEEDALPPSQVVDEEGSL